MDDYDGPILPETFNASKYSDVNSLRKDDSYFLIFQNCILIYITF